MLHLLFDKEIIELDDQQILPYGEPIKNAYFELTVEKKYTIDQPIYVILNSNNRGIYESIKNNLTITQVNPDALMLIQFV